MDTYAKVVTIVLLILTALCGWNGVHAFRRGSGKEDKALRKAASRKGLAWLSMGLMLLFGALYILLRTSWLMLAMVIMAWMAVSYAIGSGLGKNMKKH